MLNCVIYTAPHHAHSATCRIPKGVRGALQEESSDFLEIRGTWSTADLTQTRQNGPDFATTTTF
jgi:hypothetical protein